MALHLSTIEKTKVIASDSNLGLLVTPADFGPRSQRMLCKSFGGTPTPVCELKASKSSVVLFLRRHNA